MDISLHDSHNGGEPNSTDLGHKFNRSKVSRAHVLHDTGCVRTPPSLSRHHPSEGFTLFTFEKTSAKNPSLSKQLSVLLLMETRVFYETSGYLGWQPRHMRAPPLRGQPYLGAVLYAGRGRAVTQGLGLQRVLRDPLLSRRCVWAEERSEAWGSLRPWPPSEGRDRASPAITSVPAAERSPR